MSDDAAAPTKGRLERWLDRCVERWPLLTWTALAGVMGFGALVAVAVFARRRLTEDDVLMWAGIPAGAVFVLGVLGRYWRVAKWLLGIGFFLACVLLGFERNGWETVWVIIAALLGTWALNAVAGIIREHLANQRRTIELLEAIVGRRELDHPDE
jgi:hypothetical protein